MQTLNNFPLLIICLGFYVFSGRSHEVDGFHNGSYFLFK